MHVLCDHCGYSLLRNLVLRSTMQQGSDMQQVHVR
jgi:hypothetical protein